MKIYGLAITLAVLLLVLASPALATFPGACEWRPKQVLDEDFWPEDIP